MLSSTSGNAFCSPRFTFLLLDEIPLLNQVISRSGDLMIRWSHDQCLNGLFVHLSSLTDDLQCKKMGLVHNCMTLNFMLVFSFHWYYSSSQDHLFFCGVTVQPISALTTSPSFVPSMYFIATFLLLVPKSGTEILIMILHAISIQIFAWSQGKLDLSEFPCEKSIDFLLRR